MGCLAKVWPQFSQDGGQAKDEVALPRNQAKLTKMPKIKNKEPIKVRDKLVCHIGKTEIILNISGTWKSS